MLKYFQERVVPVPESGCWLWLGHCEKWGYAIYQRWTNGNHKNRKNHVTKMHRWAYAHFVGPIPDGLCVLHKCDVRCCVNPAHLWLGTRTDNQRDMANKDRGRNQHSGRTRCTKGHPYDDANTYFTADGRQCKTCKRERKRELRRRKLQAALATQ